jgi:hypothetical protein
MDPYLDHHPRGAPIIFSPAPVARCFIEARRSRRRLSMKQILVAPRRQSVALYQIS